MTPSPSSSHNFSESHPSTNQGIPKEVDQLRGFNKFMRGFVWVVGLTPLLACLFLTFSTISLSYPGSVRCLGYMLMLVALVVMVKGARKIYPADAWGEMPDKKRARCTAIVTAGMVISWVGASLGNFSG